MSFALVLLLILLIIALVIWYLPYLRLKLLLNALEKKGHQVPVLLTPTIPFIGQSLGFYRDQEKFLVENHAKHGKAFGFFLQNQVHFSIDMKTYCKEFYSFSDESLSMDVLTSIYPLSESWIFLKVLRTAHPPNLLADTENIHDQFQKFLDDEFSFPNNETEHTRDLYDFFYRACAVFNLWTFIGLDYSLQGPLIKALGEIYPQGGEETNRHYSFPMFLPVWKSRLARYGPLFENLLMPIIKQRRKEYEEDNSQSKNRRDLLQVFLEYKDEDTGYPLTDDQILREIFSLLQAAGSVATSMADVVKRMLHEDAQGYLRKIEQEQRQVIREDGSEFNAATLAKMIYFDAVIRETLRLEFTLTSWRKAHEDIHFQDGLVIPKNQLILMTMVGINFDEDLFSDNQKWNPDRHTVGESNKKGPSPFIWGAGLHPCAGRKHAQLGMKLPPLMMLRQFQMRTSKDATLFHVKKRESF